jgi:hypothetical protein
LSFYLNEGGGNVTITYEDGSTNANYDGARTGTNLTSGRYTFSLGAHTGYAISVYKAAAGVPTLTAGIASGIAFDAADNLYLNSSGIGLVQSRSLGISAIAMTSGHASGATDFRLAFPASSVRAVSITAISDTFINPASSSQRLFYK